MFIVHSFSPLLECTAGVFICFCSFLFSLYPKHSLLLALSSAPPLGLRSLHLEPMRNPSVMVFRGSPAVGSSGASKDTWVLQCSPCGGRCLGPSSSSVTNCDKSLLLSESSFPCLSLTSMPGPLWAQLEV